MKDTIHPAETTRERERKGEREEGRERERERERVEGISVIRFLGVSNCNGIYSAGQKYRDKRKNENTNKAREIAKLSVSRPKNLNKSK